MKIDAKALDIALDVFSASERAPYGEEEVHEALRKTITAYLNAIEEAGFVVVPREPTEAMCVAADKDLYRSADDQSWAHEIWTDMIRAMLAEKDAT